MLHIAEQHRLTARLLALLGTQFGGTLVMLLDTALHTTPAALLPAVEPICVLLDAARLLHAWLRHRRREPGASKRPKLETVLQVLPLASFVIADHWLMPGLVAVTAVALARHVRTSAGEKALA